MIAKVELISIHSLAVFKWLRKEMRMTVLEAKNHSKNGITIDFNDDYQKAINLYEYIHNCGTSHARLIIDNQFNNMGCIGAFVVDTPSEEDIKYSKEFEV